MIDNPIGATAALPPTLAARPFQEQDASALCSVFDKQVQHDTQQDTSVRLFTALDRPGCCFNPTPEQLSMFGDAPSAPLSQELSCKLPPTADAQGLLALMQDCKILALLGWRQETRPVSCVSDADLGPLASMLSQVPETCKKYKMSGIPVQPYCFEKMGLPDRKEADPWIIIIIIFLIILLFISLFSAEGGEKLCVRQILAGTGKWNFISCS